MSHGRESSLEQAAPDPLGYTDLRGVPACYRSHIWIDFEPFNGCPLPCCSAKPQGMGAWGFKVTHSSPYLCHYPGFLWKTITCKTMYKFISAAHSGCASRTPHFHYRQLKPNSIFMTPEQASSQHFNWNSMGWDHRLRTQAPSMIISPRAV